MRLQAIGLALIVLIPLGTAACSRGDEGQANASAAAHSAEQQRNLTNFDDLDFRVYSGQKWDEFKLSHAPDILVHYPDGTTTTGIPDHIKKLTPQFTFALDTSIKEHPIKLADGNYTAVQGIMTGTFSKPLDMGNGKVIQPTGKKFTLPMMTVGRWENGLMKEEWLFLDNASFMSQIGAS
ncbi:MAG: ester cyclase [Sphingomonadales bacterium]